MEKRVIFLDYVRVLACFMVIMVHSCEFFFIDGQGIGIRSVQDGFWVSVVDSAFRCSVPLFVMVSGYLLVPLRGGVAAFYGRRMTRVLLPFLLWSVLYVVLPVLWGQGCAETCSMLLRLFTNFNDASGHLWFVYMLLGVYLFMPVLSPWLERASRRQERGFLLLWFASSFFPYVRRFCGDIYGECYWNEYHTLWYFSGFIGYVVLAHYCRRYVHLSLRNTLLICIPMYLVGYAVTSTVWYGNIFTANTLQELELSWRFCTPNVIMTALAVFLIMRHTECLSAWLYRPVREVSRLSYGIYLMHIFVLNYIHSCLEGLFTTPWTILLVGVLTFVVCIALAKLLSMLPGSRYVLG